MAYSQAFRGLILGLRKHLWLCLLILLVIVVGGFLAYRSYSAHADRQKFVQARAAIDTIYAEIAAKVYEPDNYKRTSDCSRSSQEFSQGPLSCSVGTEFVYGVNEEQEAAILFREMQSVIASRPDLLKPTKPLATSITDTLVIDATYHSAEDYLKTDGGLDCSIKYTYDTPQETDPDLNIPNKEVLSVAIGCDGSARNQYYSMED